ncbi:MAG TPA: hypothetical protein VFX64_03085 [Candidatus Nitrosotalea sp.]|nr:hypothetical protein [Candidatus Nitrosotalea sp.]
MTIKSRQSILTAIAILTSVILLLPMASQNVFAIETTNQNVKPVTAVTPQENDPQIAANGKLAMQLSGEIDNIKTKLKTADSATQVQLNTQLTELEKQLDVVKTKMRDLGVPTTEEFNKDPKYWISKATGVNMTPKATSRSSCGSSIAKGYNVENIEEMEVDGKPVEILGSIVLKAVLIPLVNSMNRKLEIYQSWRGWIPDEMRLYMSDPRMHALKQFYRDIWSENLKKDLE